MKHIVILGDGMADEPIEALEVLPPLQAADTPYMDKLAALAEEMEDWKHRTGWLSSARVKSQYGGFRIEYAVRFYEGRGVLELPASV